jgi:voltage-gated potassium channel
MVVGTIIFFGAIIASVTSYFMRPRQHPTRQIITTVQYNLGILEELSADELETLRETAVGLIETRLDQLKREPA